MTYIPTFTEIKKKAFMQRESKVQICSKADKIWAYRRGDRKG
jgi:hypothetical protein